MYVYVIKCVNYFKIGYSNNPTARRATIQTHNPLDVKICALLKTSNAVQLEKQLHIDFVHRKSRGEWFELKHNDLEKLKIEMGFTFKIPLSKLFDDGDYDNSEKKLATKESRSINLLVDDLAEYFQELFEVEILNTLNIRKSVMKYGHEAVKDTIDVMFEKDYKAEYILKNLLKFSKSSHLKITDPEQYFIHRLKGMFWGRYQYSIDEEDCSCFKEAFKRIIKFDDSERSLSVFQSTSYKLEWVEMLGYIDDYLKPSS